MTIRLLLFRIYLEMFLSRLQTRNKGGQYTCLNLLNERLVNITYRTKFECIAEKKNILVTNNGSGHFAECDFRRVTRCGVKRVLSTAET